MLVTKKLQTSLTHAPTLSVEPVEWRTSSTRTVPTSWAHDWPMGDCPSPTWGRRYSTINEHQLSMVRGNINPLQDLGKDLQYLWSSRMLSSLFCVAVTCFMDLLLLVIHGWKLVKLASSSMSKGHWLDMVLHSVTPMKRFVSRRVSLFEQEATFRRHSNSVTWKDSKTSFHCNWREQWSTTSLSKPMSWPNHMVLM